MHGSFARAGFKHALDRCNSDTTDQHGRQTLVGWQDDKLDDASRLLFRARLLLEGMYVDRHGTKDYVFPPRKNMKWEDAESAVLRAAAVLAAAAVNILADELDFRAPLTEEQLREFEEEEAREREQNENPPQTPE